jgi:hypothetical protein
VGLLELFDLHWMQYGMSAQWCVHEDGNAGKVDGMPPSGPECWRGLPKVIFFAGHYWLSKVITVFKDGLKLYPLHHSGVAGGVLHAYSHSRFSQKNDRIGSSEKRIRLVVPDSFITGG